MKASASASVLAMAAALAASPFAAAENQGTVLAGLQAPVMVNQGEAYRAASQGMALSAGDQVMVMNGGAAQIAYPNGCVLEVGANELVRIDTGEACASSAATAGTYQQAGSGTGGAGGGAAGIGTELAVIAGAVVGGAAFIEVTENDDDDASR